MEMHLTRVILGESKVKGVLKQRKQSKNNSKSRMRRLSIKMEMHPVGVILEDSKVKGVLKQQKQSKIKNKGRVTVKANSKSRMRRLSTKMEMHPVGVILEDSKVKGVLKQQKQSKIKNKGRVAANKAKSQQKTTVTSLQTTVRATKAMTRPAHLTIPRRDIPTCGRRTPSSRA